MSADVPPLNEYEQRQLRDALAEDLGDRGDITSALTLGGRGPVATGRIVAKQRGCLSGVDLAAAVFGMVDEATELDLKLGNGDAVEPGDVLLTMRGPAASLLEAERTALNILSHLSGVATLTMRFVEAVAGTHARIVDTRKTTPGWRLREKRAVKDGGGHNHRIGLYDEVLIKENHLAIAGLDDITAVVRRVRQDAPAGTRIIVEAEDLKQGLAAADGGADVLLLDNFSLEDLAAAVVRLGKHPRRAEFAIEASGNMSLERVPAVAATGVDRISVGALTHSAPVLDLSMLLDVTSAAAQRS